MIDRNLEFIFIHVPRTGGYSAYKMLGYNKKPPGPTHTPRFMVAEDYFSFGFIRNPWDRMYSCYRRQCEYEKLEGRSFKYYLFEGLQDNATANCAMWYLDGCDYIGRYENLQADWSEIQKRMGIDQESLPWLNSRGNSDYRGQYDAELVDFIATNHADDITYGGYTFE